MQKQFMGVAALGAVLAVADASHAQAVRWRIEDGGNGHWYAINPPVPGLDAALLASPALVPGGSAVSISSEAENQFVIGLMQASAVNGAWIGFFRLGSEDFRWADGSPVTWSGWGGSNCGAGPYPNDGGTPGQVGVKLYNRTTDCGWNWDDIPFAWEVIPIVVEWSADCNNDGIVDYGQILSGQLPDGNGNGIPDSCDNIFHVPGNFATIQAAIDAIPVGTPALVLVAAGTYSGPIDFRGRNVVVRGADAATTFIQGSGGQVSSVVRMSGNEPATAALERFTIRGGLTGSPIPQAPQFLVGGGLFANESAAKVRDCTFEGNFASYGGGAYLRNSSTTFERCTFRLNRAGAFGGAAQFLNSTAEMTDCRVEQNSCESRGGGLHLFGGTTLLTRVTVSGNLSTSIMGGISFEHGGTPSASARLVDCVVTSNSAAVAQGGIGILAAPGTVPLSLSGSTACVNVPRPNIAGPWQDLGGNAVCICAADLTGNEIVNGDDLGVLLASWGPCTAVACPADLNDDDVVNGDDLGVLLASWGPCAG